MSDLQASALHLRDALGVDHIVYHWISLDGEQFGCGTYDPRWAQRYQDCDYIRVDPVVLASFNQVQPVDWKTLDWSSRAVQGLRRDAKLYGIGNQGYSVPVRGPNGQFALFTVSHECLDDTWDQFTRDRYGDLILTAHLFNAKALQLHGERAPEPVAALSPREVDALTYLAMGYARGHVSDLLQISEHTLRSYIETARLKLGASNTIHAVARALSEGLILTGGAVRQASGDWPGRDVAQTRPPATASNEVR